MNNNNILIVHSGSAENNTLISSVESIFDMEFVLKTTSCTDALTLIQKHSFNLIFIEHNENRHIDSINIIKYVRELLHYSVPIVIFTNVGSQEIAIKAMLSGANDYFVTQRINYTSLESRLNDVLLCHKNILKIKSDLKRYKDLCSFDELTNLYNRYGLKKYLAKELSFAIRHNLPLTCLYLDLDAFKIVNDAQGHNIGDDILVETAKRLKLCLREEDIISRYGGDEFIIICIGLSDKTKIIALANKIIKSIKNSYQTPKGSVYINISIGISISNKNSTLQSLINNADIALNKSKRTKGIFSFYKM